MSENKTRNLINKALFSLVFFRIEKMFANQSKKTISITDELSETLGLKKEKYSVVHDGVDLKKFDYRKNKDKIKKRLNLKDKKIIIFSSILDPCQNPEIIVRAAEHVVKKIPNIVFFMTGKGTSVNSMKELIKRRGLDKYFIFTGWITDEDFPYYLAASDLGLVTHPDNMASRVMFPIKLSEYWAMGKPAVMSNLPQLKKVVDKTGGGLLFDPNSAEDLADKIVLAFKSNMKKMGEGGRKLIEKEYDWDKVSIQFVEEIEEIIRTKKKN